MLDYSLGNVFSWKFINIFAWLICFGALILTCSFRFFYNSTRKFAKNITLIWLYADLFPQIFFELSNSYLPLYFVFESWNNEFLFLRFFFGLC